MFRNQKITEIDQHLVKSDVFECDEQQIEMKIRTQSGPDWSKMGQIQDFVLSDFSTFWRDVLKTDLKKSQICPILRQSDRKSDNHASRKYLDNS